MENRIMPPPQDGHVPIPRTCEYVTSHGKGNLQMCLRILRWDNYPGLSGWIQCDQKNPCKRQAGVSESDVEVGGLQSRTAGGLWKLEKAREGVLPQTLRRERSPAHTLVPAQRDPCRNSRSKAIRE